MTITNDRDLLAWLDRHSERGRLLKEEGRNIANQKTAKVWHGREIAWRDELVSTVKPSHPSWADDLLYIGDHFERGRGEQKHLKYTEAKFVESAQFHAARLYVLRDFRAELRSKQRPNRKTGPKAKNMDAQITEARTLRRAGEANSDRRAAEMAIERHGKGDCANDTAAVEYVRHRISSVPRGIGLNR